jgi:hypothetical protein
LVWRGHFKLDVVRVAKRQMGASGTHIELPMRNPAFVQELRRSFEFVLARDCEAQVIESDPVLIETIASDRTTGIRCRRQT